VRLKLSIGIFKMKTLVSENIPNFPENRNILMKKIFLFLLLATAAFSLNSCSGNDSSDPEPGGTISFMFNGAQKTFHNVTVSENLYFEGTPDEYSELFVFGIDPDIPGENVRFTLYKNHMEDIVSVFYTISDVEYERKENQFTLSLTANGNNNRLKGTFSGDMYAPFNTVDDISVSNGTFDIQY
jgi:hypothetical protein